MKEKPVFVINGFLEAGKSRFIKFTMEQGYFYTKGKTLLIVCEEGEEEYGEDLLARTNTVALYCGEPDEVTPEKLARLEALHNPERIMIEWNGLWMQDLLELPDEWFVNQMVTILDTSTLDLYLKNMKAYMGPMLKGSELVICNRADRIPQEVLANYHLQIRAMAQKSEIIFEGEDGEIRGDFSIELPYDIEKEELKIESQDFGIFYIDAMDRPEKYLGKTVEFTGQVLKPPSAPKDVIIPGRMVMTCCENDMQFLGMVCRYEGAGHYKNRDWIKVRAEFRFEDHALYGTRGPVLYAREVVRTGPIREVVRFG